MIKVHAKAVVYVIAALFGVVLIGYALLGERSLADLAQSKEFLSFLVVFFAVLTVYLARRRCVASSSGKHEKYDVLSKLVDVGLRSSEIVMQIGHIKHAVDVSSAQSQSMASAVEEMVVSIKQISERTQGISADSKNAENSASQGVALSEEGAQAMEGIAQTANKASQEVKMLAEESDKIGGIVLQIKNIADQTNLLALNATIEAARAGEAGKGFAVVASEVKALATQTSRATEDIEKRISGLHDRITQIVEAMGQSVATVDNGQKIIKGLGEQLKDILSQVGGVSGHMTEIAAILTQQTAAANDVAKGTGAIATISKENVSDIDKALTQMDKLCEVVNGQIGSYTTLGKRAIVEIAKNDHITFKKNIADVLLGRKNTLSKDLPDHHLCRFGKWYDSVTDESILNNSSYASLLKPHQHVHEVGRKILALHESGQHDEATRAMSELANASDEVVRKLDELVTKVEM